MQFAIAYPNLRTETVAITIRKTRRCVVKYAGSVDFLQEVLSNQLVFRNDAFGVLRTVPVNVFQPLFQGIHNFHREDEVGIFGRPIVFDRGPEFCLRKECQDTRTAANFHICFF